MNRGEKSSADKSRQTKQDQAGRMQEDTQRSNMGNREHDQTRHQEDPQRSNMGNRGRAEHEQSGRSNEDMQRSDMSQRDIPPQPTKTTVPEHEEGMEEKTSAKMSPESRDTDVDTNEGRSSSEDPSRRNL